MFTADDIPAVIELVCEVMQGIDRKRYEWLQPYKIKVVWSNKMTNTAGTAKYRRGFSGAVVGGTITLSRRVWELGPEERESTVWHEMAHIVAAWGCNRIRTPTPHGRVWKAVMTLLDRDPERCHNVDVSVTAQCPQCNRKLKMSYRQAIGWRRWKTETGRGIPCGGCKQADYNIPNPKQER